MFLRPCHILSGKGNDRRNECCREKTIHGSLLLFLKGNVQLDANGFIVIPLNIIQVAQINGCKARLVARGLTRSYGVDNFETFFPVAKLTSIRVAKLTSIRVILSLVANFNRPLYQLDVKNVFLHGDSKEEVYMDPPLGFIVRGQENKVCFLKKSLYGLKQSPRAWFERFNRAVIKFGFTRWKVPCRPYHLC